MTRRPALSAIFVLANKKDTDQVTIFNENNDTSSQDQTNQENSGEAARRQQADVFVEKLLEIKREDGTPKYESVEDALDALKASQDHIHKIETENATLKTKVSEADQLRETLERLKQGNNVNEEKPNGETNQKGGLSEEAAAELIERKLKERADQATFSNNLKSVNDQLISKFGSEQEAAKAVKAKAAELGLTVNDLKNLSASAPKAVLAYFGESAKPSTSINTSTVRIPPNPSIDPLKAPEVSIISGRGATTKNQTDFVRKVREKVYKEQGIS